MSRSRAARSSNRPRSIATPRRATITLCVIARDEEAFIGECLASAEPFVDEIVVLDTGSTDSTRDIARAHGARVGTFTWCDDFAAARNVAMDLATSDWILMLDADERLQPASGPALRSFVDSNPSGPLFYAVSVENRDGDGPEDFHISSVNRFFKPIPELRYVGAIHEDLTYPPDPARARGLALPFVRITHLGYMPQVVEARDKFERNRRLLLSETVARPGDPLPWYYLGVDQLLAGRAAEAAEYLRTSLACSHNRPSWSKVDAYTQLISAYAKLADATNLQAIVAAAEQEGLLSAAARLILALGLTEHGQYAVAERHLLASLEPNQPKDSVRKQGVGGWITRMELARTYELMGNARAALRQVEHAFADPGLRDRGEHGDVASAAVRLAIEVGDMASLSRSLQAMTQPGEDDLNGHLRLLQLRSIAGPPSTTMRQFGAIDRAIGRGDWQAAYDVALTLKAATMAEAARLLFVAMRLQSGGAPGAALSLLDHLYGAQPTLPQLHALLTTVLTDLGRFDDALAANEILRSLLGQQRSAAA